MWDILHQMLIGPLPLIARTALVGVLAYVALVLLLRVSGKRTLSKLNAFDLVVTVALGSCLATTLLSKDTSLLQGATSFVVLIGLQAAIAWSSTRSSRINELVTSPPALVFYAGKPIHEQLQRERLTLEAVHAAIRSAGIVDVSAVSAVVLESDGSLSVVCGDLAHAASALPGGDEHTRAA